MAETAQAETFRTLKPLCVRLNDEALKLSSGRSNPTNIVAIVEDLLQVLERLAASRHTIDERLVNYVFFPLSHLFRDRDKFPIRSVELALQCLQKLLQTGWRVISDANLGVQLLLLLTSLAECGQHPSSPVEISEELRTAALTCVSELFQSLEQSPGCKTALFDTLNIPTVGHAITVMLDNMKHSDSRKAQISAVTALLKFCTCIASRDVLESFLPGIFSALSAVLTPTTKTRRPYVVLEQALSVLAYIAQRTLSDIDHEEALQDMIRSRHSWFKATAAQTKLVLANVTKLRRHDRSEVRSALLKLCWTVLEKCPITLAESVSMVLETTVALISDDGDDSKASRLQRLVSRSSTMEQHAKSTSYESIVSLPRTIMSNDNNLKSRSARQTATLLRVLIDCNVEMTVIDGLLQQILRDTLLSVFGFAPTLHTTSSELVSPEALIHDLDTMFEPSDYQLVSSKKSADDSIACLGELIHTISRSKGALKIASSALQEAHNGPEDVLLVSFWICLKLLQSKAQARSEFDSFLNEIQDDEQENVTRNEMYKMAISLLDRFDEGNAPDWRLQAVALEALTFQADQRRHGFRLELSDALYPVVQLLGSNVYPLRIHAIQCLNAVARSCEYSDVKTMLVDNVDYLVNAIGLRLNALDISPQWSRVLLMMIKLCGASLLPYLEDLVEGIFEALECFHGYTDLVEQLFTVLNAAVEEGVQAQPLNMNSRVEMSYRKAHRRLKSVEAVIQTSKRQAKADTKYLNQTVTEGSKLPKKMPQTPWGGLRPDEDSSNICSTAEKNEEDLSRTDSETNTSEKAGPTPTKTYLILQRIAALTQHHLPSSSTAIRMSLLSLLARAVPFLSRHEDTFLPLAHTLWPILLPRLEDKEAFVVASVLNVMGGICEGAGNFMSTRIEALWPTIRRIYAYSQCPSSDSKTHSYLASSESQPMITLARFSLVSLQPGKSNMALFEPGVTERVELSMAANQTEASQEASKKFRSRDSYTPTTHQMVQLALTNFLLQVVSHVRIPEAIYVEILSKILYCQLLTGVPQGVRVALAGTNPDAVGLVLGKKHSERGDVPAAALNHRWTRTPFNVSRAPEFVCIQ